MIEGKCFGQDLDGNVAFQLRITSTPHFAHTALAKEPSDFI